MSTEELFEFIKGSVHNFNNPRIIENGIAYHYTSHFRLIVKSGGFLGAPISTDLDRTQTSLSSPPATHSPGVVFAYLNFDDAFEEGFDCEIVKITFSKAIIATHEQENLLEEFTDNIAGVDHDLLETVIILNTDITSFELL